MVGYHDQFLILKNKGTFNIQKLLAFGILWKSQQCWAPFGSRTAAPSRWGVHSRPSPTLPL